MNYKIKYNFKSNCALEIYFYNHYKHNIYMASLSESVSLFASLCLLLPLYPDPAVSQKYLRSLIWKYMKFTKSIVMV